MNKLEIEKYVRERAHQMFTEAPGLWRHQGVIRQYLRLAYLDGAAQQSAPPDGQPVSPNSDDDPAIPQVS